MGKRIKRLRDMLYEKSGNASMIEVYGFCELLLTGCTALLDFDDKTVLVETVNGNVTVRGTNLSITAFRADLLSVSGNIGNIELGGEVC